MFINLKMDPCILHSSPRRACVNLPPIAFRLPLTSALRHYSDSHSHRCSDSTQNSTLAVLSICLTAILYSRIPTPLGAPCLSALQILRTPLGGPLRHLLGHPLGHSCLIPSYKFKPAPSDPIQTSVPVCITIQILVIQLCSEVRSGICSDICVSLCLTSSNLCPWGPLRPPSLSVLRVPCGSEPLITLAMGELKWGCEWISKPAKFNAKSTTTSQRHHAMATHQGNTNEQRLLY
jgi:hypothetical protein